jgi:hypothetical protein
LHADTDCQARRLPFDRPAYQNAIAFIAALGHRLHGLMTWLTRAAWVHVEAAAQEQAVEPVAGKPPAWSTALKYPAFKRAWAMVTLLLGTKSALIPINGRVLSAMALPP